MKLNSRRDALRLASNGFGLMALSALMADKSYAGLAAPKLHFVPKVRSSATAQQIQELLVFVTFRRIIINV